MVVLPSGIAASQDREAQLGCAELSRRAREQSFGSIQDHSETQSSDKISTIAPPKTGVYGSGGSMSCTTMRLVPSSGHTAMPSMIGVIAAISTPVTAHAVPLERTQVIAPAPAVEPLTIAFCPSGLTVTILGGPRGSPGPATATPLASAKRLTTVPATARMGAAFDVTITIPTRSSRVRRYSQDRELRPLRRQEESDGAERNECQGADENAQGQWLPGEHQTRATCCSRSDHHNDHTGKTACRLDVSKSVPPDCSLSRTLAVERHAGCRIGILVAVPSCARDRLRGE